MRGPQALQAYADLVEVRRKAARRNGFFILIGYFITIVFVGYLLRHEYAIELDILGYAFLALNFTMLTNQQMTSEIVHKSILDLIDALIHAQEDSP